MPWVTKDSSEVSDVGEVYRRGFIAYIAHEAHLEDPSDPVGCRRCVRWAIRVAQGAIDRDDTRDRCEQGQQWQHDINAALALLDRKGVFTTEPVADTDLAIVVSTVEED